MPLYEYQCSKCGEKIEVLQKFSDEPLKRHKGCRGTLHRLVSVAGLHFKGSGFYVNDYAPKSSGKADGNAESSGESKSETKSSDSKASESKPSESKTSESKSESKPAAKETKTESKPAKTP